MEYKQQTLPGMAIFRNRIVDQPEKKKIIAPTERKYVPKSDNTDISSNKVIIDESSANLSINKNDFSEQVNPLRVKKQPKSINRINIQAPNHSTIPMPLEIPSEQYEQIELNFGNGIQDLGSNSGNGQISINNRKNNSANRRKILAPTDTSVSETIAKNIGTPSTIADATTENITSEKISSSEVDRYADLVSEGTERNRQRTTKETSEKTAKAAAADYIDLTDTRPQYTVAEDPKSFTNYTRSKIYTADGKSQYLYSPSLSEWGKIDAGTSKINKSKIQYIPETEVLEYKTPQIKASDNTYKPFSLDKVEYPNYSKEAEQAIQDVSTEKTRNDFFRRSNAYTSDPNTGKIVARGKSTSPLRKVSEDMSTPKSSSLRKYGAYALGALAGTALVGALFFGDNKGEQTNAQLYGQQPLY